MPLFCQFKNVLGQPGKGVHAARFAGLALNDLLGTLALAWLLQKFTKLSLPVAFVVMFGIGMLLHWLFCVDTAVMRALKI